MPGEDAKTENPLCVAQTATFEKDLIRVERQLSFVLEDEVSVELIQMLVWLLTLNRGAHEPAQSLFDAPVLFLVFMHPLEYILLSLLLFEIGLAIERFRLDIADAFG